MREVTFAATQMALSWDLEDNLNKAERLVRQAHQQGAQVIASNRTGVERDDEIETTFYGSSFVTDQLGEKWAEADREQESVPLATLDLDKCADIRRAWGLFRDRRPELYTALNSLTGN